MTTRFLITGPSGVGKSTLACSLYVRIKMGYGTIGHEVSLVELDPWSDTHGCILGRKPWEDRNKRSGQDVFEDYKQNVATFKSRRSELVIGDMEGSMEWRYNELLVGCADYAILLHGQNNESELHRQLLAQLQIPILGEFVSAPQGHVSDHGLQVISGLQRSLVPDNPGVRDIVRMMWQAFARNR